MASQVFGVTPHSPLQTPQSNHLIIQWSPFIVITMGHSLFDNNQMIMESEGDDSRTGTSIKIITILQYVIP